MRYVYEKQNSSFREKRCRGARSIAPVPYYNEAGTAPSRPFCAFGVVPQVLADKGYDGRMADVWSMGVILYVLLAGFLPFDEPSMSTLFSKIQAADFSYPRYRATFFYDAFDNIALASKLSCFPAGTSIVLVSLQKNPRSALESCLACVTEVTSLGRNRASCFARCGSRQLLNKHLIHLRFECNSVLISQVVLLRSEVCHRPHISARPEAATISRPDEGTFIFVLVPKVLTVDGDVGLGVSPFYLSCHFLSVLLFCSPLQDGA